MRGTLRSSRTNLHCATRGLGESPRPALDGSCTGLSGDNDACGRGGDRPRRGHGQCRASGRDAPRRAGVGSKDPAERGELTIFASGPAEAHARVAPLFDALGQRTIWVGEAGAGTRLKLVNNTWLAFATEAVATSVALAHLLGVETETVVDALGGGPLMSTWQAAKLQRIAHGEFSPQFALSLALKDVHLALQAAGDDRFAALACLADEWQQAVEQGLGDQDLTVVTRALEQQGGTR